MGRTETIVRSERRRRVPPADRAGAARAVQRPVVARLPPVAMVPICLVAGLAAALLSSDLAWSHRVAVAATVGFDVAIALWHARPDRTNWWLAGAFAVVVTVVGSRVDVLRGAEPAWILWATALAVAVASARPLNASTGADDEPGVLMKTVAVLAATTVAFAAWWYLAGTSAIVAVTIGALPVAAVLFVGARASSRALPGSMMLVAVASGVIGTALAHLDAAPHIGQAAIAAVITGLVGVTISAAGSPFVNRLVEVLLLASLVTAAGGSTWAVVVALAIGAVAVLRIGPQTGTVAAGSRSVTGRSTDGRSSSAPEPESAAFTFDLWSALGVDHDAGSSEPDRATQSAFAQRSETSVFDEPEAITRSSS